MYDTASFSSITQAAYEAALQAGRLLKEGFNTDFEVSPKVMKNDVVTQYDFAAEKLIISLLSDEFPDHAFLCEEGGETGSQNSEMLWIVDPLDGTVNFSRHVPLFCVSIAACYRGEVISAVTYAPMTNEMFYGEKGKGAYLNGTPLKVSSQTSLTDAYVATSLSFNLSKDPIKSVELLRYLAEFSFPIRAFGSSALQLGYVASGKLDAFWSASGSLQAWDVAAGMLLIEEAGGLVSRYDGAPFILGKDSTILASNNRIHPDIVKHIQSFLESR